MIPDNPLHQLFGLDKASPQFHEQLHSFLRGDVYRDTLPTLQNENLISLVECLDSVSLHIISPRITLKVGEGSRQYFRLHDPRISGLLARTQEYMR